MASSTRKLLTDWAIGKAIIEGEHDEDLHIVEQAVRARRKMLARVINAQPGCRCVCTEGKLSGREGTIVKVNPKTYVVSFDGDSAWSHYNCSRPMITVTPLPDRAARIANLAKIGLDAKGEFLPLPVGCSKDMLANGATCACPECDREAS